MVNVGTPQELKTFANEPILIIDMMQTPVESNGWSIEDADFVVVSDGQKPFIGRHLFEALGISFTQTLDSVDGSMINNITTQGPFNSRKVKQFPQLVSRIGRSKVHIVNSRFHKHIQPKHQKGIRVSINLQDGVNTRIKKLIQEGHIEDLNNYSDQYFFLQL